MTGRRDDVTAPVGYGDDLQPIEEVVTTATRLPRIPWGAFVAGTLLAILGYELFLSPYRDRWRKRKRRP